MSVIVDILKRTFYLSFFFILLPIGAYTIHNGSSATVAMVSYMVLSVSMPMFYLSSKRSGFGPNEKRIKRWAYLLGWVIVQFATYQLFMAWNPTFIWTFSDIIRDIIFAIIMYIQVAVALCIAYALSGSSAQHAEKLEESSI